MATIVPLSAVDPKLVDQLLDMVFGVERRARTAYRIRHGIAPLETLSFAALDEEEYLVGTIQLWPVALLDPAKRPHPMVMVGPVAVAFGYRGQGYGTALMAASLGGLDAGFEQGAPPLPQVMLGDPAFFGRWNFTAQHSAGWTCPGPFDPAHLLVRTGNPAILPREGILGPWRL